ncbi:melanoma antigen preferentially expressed in tumors-like [Tenrec ecaudatus]|uniref:melanoma antigen preferentially expressed in tumors-like n=1 Tax=Tenrec ecaudatus TaxID=94439 RepID=UPI003F59103F
MSSKNPPRLLDLSIQSVLQDEASAIAALEWLPTELFPPLSMAAVIGGHGETVKAMVGSWPFIRLPLGALMKSSHSHQDILKAALDAFDILLSPKVPPRRCKLRVLDLCLDTDTNFWKVWSGTESIASVTSSEDPVATRPWTLTHTRKDSRTGEKPQPLASAMFLTDLRVLETGPDEVLTFLMERAQQDKDLPNLCCRELEFVGLPPLPIMEEILKAVQLGDVQEVVLHCRWDLHTLEWFLPYLAQMGQLHILHLTGIILEPPVPDRMAKVEELLEKLTSQLLGLHQLQHLILESVFFRDEQLGQLLRSLSAPLESLTLSYCVPVDSDMRSLCSCPCTSLLSYLNLSDLHPKKIPKVMMPKYQLYKVQLRIPFHMKCKTCGEYVYKGTKVSARKETVNHEDYAGLTISCFYIKCKHCGEELTLKTDPESTDDALQLEALVTCRLRRIRKRGCQRSRSTP